MGAHWHNTLTMAKEGGRFFKDLCALDGSAAKIGALSSYMQITNDPKTLCKTWMSALEAAEPARAVPLLHLANDVMQRTRSKYRPNE